MGMAASQARYLSLSARKTNTEYEGQQLNQQRLNLANQSADLFNQMLTMSVPTCPDSNDFTTLQYAWSDGINDEVISDYYQIATPNEEFNYVVTSYHYENVYTGQSKKMNAPEIQATHTNHFTTKPDKTYTVNQSTYHKESQPGAGDDSYTLVVERNGITSTHVFKRANTQNDVDAVEEIDALTGRTTPALAGDKATKHIKGTDKPGGGTYDTNEWVFDEDIKVKVHNKDFNPEQPVSDTNKPMVEATIAANTPFKQVDFDDEDQRAIIEQLLSSYGAKYDPAKTYYCVDTGVDSGLTDAAGNPINYYAFICGEEMDDAVGSQGDVAKVEVRSGDKTIYYTDGEFTLTGGELASLDLTDPDPTQWKNTLYFHSVENDPTYTNFTAVGNCDLNEVSLKEWSENEDMQVEIKQILKDMKANNPIAYGNLSACFNPDTGEYLGGIYSFKMFGHTYYSTTTDLEDAVKGAWRENRTATNGIDSQNKFMYYTSTYLNTKIEDTKRALMETDGKGRFSTVKFEDDDTIYTLKCETITDDAAYQDAMNQYFYKQEKYDKAVADINAKTEIIQAEDRELQLRLEQLGTEQTALQTEMEACQKVVSKNIEGSFKTFGG